MAPVIRFFHSIRAGSLQGDGYVVVIGYHASHEQHSPRSLLEYVQLAEAVGFDAAMCSDHLSPWTRRQGQSGFAWSWLGAALASTSIPFGVVNAPGQRYHPVIVAQAVATLEQMFPGRFWVAFGSGEALNEHVTGQTWPKKAERQQRLREAVKAIRGLLAGERLSADGAVRVHDARVWSLPEQPPPILGAAVSAETAGWLASWADGLITVAAAERTRTVLDRYRSAGGGGQAHLQIHLSLEATPEAAVEAAREQWSHATVPEALLPELENPEDFEARITSSHDALDQAVVISHSAETMAERIAQISQGFDQVYLHHVGLDQRGFLERCRTELLPALRTVL